MYTHDLFYLQQEWEAWLAPVYNRFRQLNHNKHNVQNITVNKTYQNQEHAPTVKMGHNNYNTMFCMRSKTLSKTSIKTNGANFQLVRVI